MSALKKADPPARRPHRKKTTTPKKRGQKKASPPKNLDLSKASPRFARAGWVLVESDFVQNEIKKLKKVFFPSLFFPKPTLLYKVNPYNKIRNDKRFPYVRIIATVQ